MDKEKVVVTVTKCVQIGPEDWDMRPISRIFDYRSALKDMLIWAESLGFKEPRISDLNFSELQD